MPGKTILLNAIKLKTISSKRLAYIDKYSNKAQELLLYPAIPALNITKVNMIEKNV